MRNSEVTVWQWFTTRVLDRPLLSLLLLVDLSFVAIHLWLWARGQHSPQLNIEKNGGIPELFNYLKWAASTVACVYAFSRRRAPLYLAWAILFFYFLLDDAIQIHEEVGGILVAAFDIGPALALRGQDFGELAVSLAVGTVLFGIMAAAYWRVDTSKESKRFTQRQMPWLAVLIFCGVIVDMLHVQIISTFSSAALAMTFEVFEDGGEMIAASFLTAACVRQAVTAQTHPPT